MHLLYGPPQESCQDLARVLAAPLGQGGAVGQPGSLWDMPR